MKYLTIIIGQIICINIYAQVPDLWGNLAQGKYHVGFQTFYEYDKTRPPIYEQKPLRAEQQVGRAIQVNVWYPSLKKGTVLTLGDYFNLTASEVDFENHSLSLDSLIKVVQQEQTNSHGININQPGLVSFLKTKPAMMASSAVQPADGKFPIIMIGPETAFKWCISAEYLASHGYIVVTTPLTGSTEKLPDFERTLFEKESFIKSTEASITDLQFVTAFVKTFPYADPNKLGLFGYSSNISEGLGLIFRGIEFDAIVSLEGAIGGYIGGEVLSMTPFYSPYLITQPILHIFNPVFGYFDHWMAAYKYSERTLIATYDIRHEHLTTYGALDRFVNGVSGQTKNAPQLAFETASLYGLNFFNHHLKTDEAGKTFINRSLRENGISEEFQQEVSPEWQGIERREAIESYDEYELKDIYRSSRFEGVVRIYSELSAINAQPFSKSTFFNFGRFLKSVKERETWYSHYADSYPNFSEPYYLLGREQERLEKKAEAAKSYHRALVLFEETDHILLENIFRRNIQARLERLRK